ncbi:MAG TPA: carboxypeptidase-like regulatory domain-containing protein, partial [Flavobacteriales bacterium]|nr:carboxypeptidase-like regulatory domain-containing protein [Flavobacteriales bacterium]
MLSRHTIPGALLRGRRVLLIAGLLLAGVLTAQTTRISGHVTDAVTGEALPFVNIAFTDSRIGTTSDFDGNYELDTYYATDSIRVSSVGYIPAAFAVKKDQEQRIDIALEPSQVQLQEVVIKPSDENPAHTILRRVIANKPANNREKLEAYDYEAYNKIEFDLNNITQEFTEKKLFKPFAF